MEHVTICLNCEKALSMAVNFCPHCGQKANTHKLSLHDIIHDVIHYVTHADRSIFSLIRKLAIQPGLVAREYVGGKRQSYMKPLNFFLIVAGIIVFVTGLFYTPNDARSRQVEAAAAQVQNPESRQQLLAMAERMRLVNKITGKYSNVINMIATPLLAVFFWFFYRRRYNYIECLVANMYFTGFITLVYALLFVPLQNLIPGFSLWAIGLFFLFEILFRGFAFAQFARLENKTNYTKGIGVSFLVTIVWATCTYSLITYYIKYGF